MAEKEVKFHVASRDEEGNELVKVTVEGNTKLPFWNHDLKMEAAIALLGTVDRKDYNEVGLDDLFFEQLDELKERIQFLDF